MITKFSLSVNSCTCRPYPLASPLSQPKPFLLILRDGPVHQLQMEEVSGPGTQVIKGPETPHITKLGGGSDVNPPPVVGARGG